MKSWLSRIQLFLPQSKIPSTFFTINRNVKELFQYFECLLPYNQHFKTLFLDILPCFSSKWVLNRYKSWWLCPPFIKFAYVSSFSCQNLFYLTKNRILTLIKSKIWLKLSYKGHIMPQNSFLLHLTPISYHVVYQAVKKVTF